jgi:hypothetical protein
MLRELLSSRRFIRHNEGSIYLVFCQVIVGGTEKSEG